MINYQISDRITARVQKETSLHVTEQSQVRYLPHTGGLTLSQSETSHW